MNCDMKQCFIVPQDRIQIGSTRQKKIRKGVVAPRENDVPL
jgi:hypothetical protein